MKYLTMQKTINEVTDMGFWWDDERLGWQIEFDKLNKIDFDRLEIEKDKLYDALEKLYEWKVIR